MTGQKYSGAGIDDYVARLEEKALPVSEAIKECAWLAESVINSVDNQMNPAYNIGFNDAAKKIAALIWAKLKVA